MQLFYKIIFHILMINLRLFEERVMNYSFAVSSIQGGHIKKKKKQ